MRTKNIIKHSLTLLSFSLMLIVVSCIPTNNAKKKGGGTSSAIKNTPDSVSYGQSRILSANPIVKSGCTSLPKDCPISPNVDIGLYITENPVFITGESSLKRSCKSPDNLVEISECFEILEDANATSLAPIDGRWAFEPNSNEFLQVNLYAHMRDSIDRFHTALGDLYSIANPLGIAGGGSYYSSISPWLYTNNGFWFDTSLKGFSNATSLEYTQFQPAGPALLFGRSETYPNISTVQDPSVIYHELGHAYVKIMINIRNTVSSSVIREVDMGQGFYDEAISLNEGIADFFSYFMNNRTHVAEWSVGFTFEQSRALDEDDMIHAPGISTSSDARLSYPKYLNYDPNKVHFPTNNENYLTPDEDSHYAGQIVTHYLVALTKELQTYCSVNHTLASNYVLFLLAETLAEIGDLTGKGSNNRSNYSTAGSYNINLDIDNAYDWTRMVTPINFRSFFQIFSRNLVTLFTNSSVLGNSPSTINLCGNTVYNQDQVESLLDQYGLLLFETYNDNGNGKSVGHSGTPLLISPGNRLNSILITKDLLGFDEDDEAEAFIIDNQSEIKSILSSHIGSGQVSASAISPSITSVVPYNNGNGRASPGEIFGFALNLYNKANTPMAGIQILGNDWDHAKLESGELKPCNTFEDEFPASTAGAADTTGETGNTEGECSYITRTNGSALEPLAPICFVLYSDENETKWISQKEYVEKMNFPETKCLLSSDNPYYSDYTCLLQVIPGADQAYFSKIDANTNWKHTLQNPNTGVPGLLNSHNIILFQASSWITPGTTFNCRFRARFSNCKDCYQDPDRADKDDYLDYEYSGNRPFKILNLQFSIID